MRRDDRRVPGGKGEVIGRLSVALRSVFRRGGPPREGKRRRTLQKNERRVRLHALAAAVAGGKETRRRRAPDGSRDLLDSGGGHRDGRGGAGGDYGEGTAEEATGGFQGRGRNDRVDDGICRRHAGGFHHELQRRHQPVSR